MSMVDNNMTLGHAPVTSLLTERPPENYRGGRSAATPEPLPVQHPGGGSSRLVHQQYDVVYEDIDGSPLLAFADGQWWELTGLAPTAVTVRYALRRDPSWAGAVVQTVCLWMRSHPNDERSFDLATELALAVGELARRCD